MARDFHKDPAEPQDQNTQAAGGGPIGIGHPSYGELALTLLDNGYEPVPIRPNSKAVAAKGWSVGAVDAQRVEDWCRSFGPCGIGLRTGHLVGLDIDSLDPDLAHQLAALAIGRFGDTIVRVGRWPKRLLVYRIEHPIPKLSLPGLDILGLGQQFVALGRHPDTGRPYDWVTGESPAELPFDQLPLVDETGLRTFLAEASTLIGIRADDRRPRRDAPPGRAGQRGPTRNAQSLVIDGRDGWLSSIAFHALHDALDARHPLDPDILTERVWIRFASTTDIARLQKDGQRSWSPDDAARKVRDKLDLLAAGRLPDRGSVAVSPPAEIGDLLAAEAARSKLGETIDVALSAAGAWWMGDRSVPAPRLGIRATVGLGKSATSRDRIAAWQKDMRALGLPHRVLIVTPSHALAEEAAAGWASRVEGMVAVLRGYEATDPVSGQPMCRDLELVRMALSEGLRAGKSVCYSSNTWHCPQYHGCPKQANKRDVAEADVVLAPYDVLFTGIGAGNEPLGLLVIDEGCWQRAEHITRGPPVEKLASAGLLAQVTSEDPELAADMADLKAYRAQAQAALSGKAPGPVTAAHLTAEGLTAEDCLAAAFLEDRCQREVTIYPGMKPHARRSAISAVKRNEVHRRMRVMWRAMADLLEGRISETGLVMLTPPEPKTGHQHVQIHGLHALVPALAALPILHLDATLRPDLTSRILPGLAVTRIEADQPHMHLTLIVGSFGKSMLCPAPKAPPEEQQRRKNRLAAVVDHVRWQALRLEGRAILVVTYKAIEAAFSGIDGVKVAHFNAIAGLDQYRDVGLLIVVGRPLPSSEALTPLVASYFGAAVGGCFQTVRRAVRLRDGQTANMRVLEHENPSAEILRAAICDDEVIQAIGRGRGVNRTATNPLEVQVLADVALPLIHDRVAAWESMLPDLMQRMLLAGLAVDSPTDAAALHPGLFETIAAADHALRRQGFNRQNPIRDTYREMAVKSAAYLRGGRGRSWRRVWWICGSEANARQRLEDVLGRFAGWRPALLRLDDLD